MLITYGPVSLNLISVNEFTRQAVYLGPNYAYTRFRLSVRAWLNPCTQGDSYQREPTINKAGNLGRPLVPPSIPTERAAPIGPPSLSPSMGPVVGPTFLGKVPPVVSDRALRHLLMQPRLPLQFSFLGGISVQSPLPGFACDAVGGPTPVECQVTEITPRTWVVDWVVETAINETYFYKGKGTLPLVLAQMWTMQHSLDSDFFTTRVIKGQTLFRMDAIASQLFVPDDFRQQLFIPPPVGFKREKVEVRNDPDNPSLIVFQVEDRQRPFGWSGANISRLNAHHRIRTTKDSLGHVFAKHWPSLRDAGWEVSKSAALVGADLLGVTVPSPLEPLFAAAALPVGWMGIRDALRLGEAGVATAFDALPVSYHTVEVEAWGSPLAQRDQMEAFARQIVSARLSSFFVFALPAALAGQAANASTNSLGQVAAGVTGTLNALIPNVGIIAAAAKAATPVIGMAAAAVSKIKSAAAGAAAGALTALVPYGVDTTIDHDINGKYIHLSHTCLSGPIGTIFSGASAVINKTPMPLMEETSLDSTLLISSKLALPTPPYSNGSRGTFLEDVVGAALQLPNALPTDMPAGKSRQTADSGAPLPLVV